MNQESIGKASGMIWNRLNDSGLEGVSFATLKKISGLRSDEAVAALGWLAREGKVQFAKSANRVRVSLVESELRIPSLS